MFYKVSLVTRSEQPDNIVNNENGEHYIVGYTLPLIKAASYIENSQRHRKQSKRPGCNLIARF